MTTTSLVVEFLVIGIFPFFSIFFLILCVIKKYDLSFILNMKDVFPLISILLIIVLYILGAIFHRVSQFLNTNTFSFIFKIRFIKNILGQKVPTNHDEWWQNYCIVYNETPENLVKRLSYEESLLRVFRATTVNASIFGAILGIWLRGTAYPQAAWISVIISMCLSLASFIAFIIQRKSVMQKFHFILKMPNNQH
jgi:hypothetical protein